jgi:hypothetical protein
MKKSWLSLAGITIATLVAATVLPLGAGAGAAPTTVAASATPAPTPTPRPTPTASKPVAKKKPAPARPHPHKTPGPVAPKRPHPHKTLGPVPPKRAHPHRAPWPITVTINTVPALSGAHFLFDGHYLTTNAAGHASYVAQHDFASHSLVAADTAVVQANTRYQFARWSGQRDPNQAFGATVTGLPLRSDYAITAAFTARQLVLPTLREESGLPLDASRVSVITVKSDTGKIVNLRPGVAEWLDSQRPLYEHSVLSVQPALYSLQSVVVGGTNVVDVGRQTFKPSATSRPVFVTRFYNLVIRGHDALWNSPTGRQAVVTFPDGSKRTYPLDTTHSLTLKDLPRGVYSVQMKAGHAVVATDQFVLSRNKVDNIAVISAGDLGLLASFLVIVALALLAIGRRAWANRLVRRFRRTLSDYRVTAPLEDALR